eukprot:CAMPEP_0197636494 /NCGR_PEP_ID=MMETSP1338-20131121/11980_1 /TAXON_ID=43686 ORGANISM="Pelagodinium beii, Strain RCC1491" /NCGR_SAMPLE_ID=MMETSP1338 /ASSEMBLY_ACC=CAM_ASM_000754 /LENGTH=575 /DNA_ID=CAMNT_0043208731 /DNA_START=41 /DNA_END=1768 /DNA_ORIENTATION=-
MAEETKSQDVELQGVVAAKSEASSPKTPSKGKRSLRSASHSCGKVLGLLACLYVFMLALDLMGVSFKALGGKGAGQLFSITDNPIAGLMVGVLATVLVQSSSTSTSIVVGLVGADQLSVHNAIPIIMGANIGTSVTNTLVSMGHAGERLELERAFAGATVHDMFNMLSVAVLLPIEVFVWAITGIGGPIYWVSLVLAEFIMGGSSSDATFTSPTKAIVDPLAKAIMDKNTKVINALSVGMPEALTPTVSVSCTSVDCSQYFCVGDYMADVWRHVNKAAYTELPRCSDYLGAADLCPGSTCLLGADGFYEDYVLHGDILDSGLLHNLGDVAGGIVGLVLSLLLLCGSLFCLVKLLHSLVMGPAKRMILKATHMNDYLAMALGAVLTILVQSSSVVTSALTPLCGVGVLPVYKMLPLTLGANIGTTFTSILAALAVFKPSTIQVAMCHLCFNIMGILIWFPIPAMRRVVVNAACLLGLYASFWRLVPLLYILVMFLAVPAVALGISLLFGISLAAGVVVLFLTLTALGTFLVWWNKGGCYKVLSKKQRESRDEQKTELEEPVEKEVEPREETGTVEV